MKLYSIAALTGLLPAALSKFVDFQPVEYVSSNGVLNVILNISLIDSLYGIEWSHVGYRRAPGYNGAPCGPTLRVRPGDRLTVTVHNQLTRSPARDVELDRYVRDPSSDDANVTIVYNRLGATGSLGEPAFGFWGFHFMNLHFHGMDFSPQAEDLHTHVDGGQSRTYTFTVPDNKEPGLYWYHNHVHGTATFSYLASLFGMILVEGTASDLTRAVGLQGAREILMIFSDGLVNPDGSVPPTFPVFGVFNWTGVTNGNMGNDTVYRVTQGETVLFRAASATSESILRLSIPNTTFVLLANDGLVLPRPVHSDVVTLPGGGRVEFAARFDTPGTYVMTRAPWNPLFPNAAACAARGLPFFPCWSFDKAQVAATIIVAAKASNYQDTIPKGKLLDTIVLPKPSDRLQTLASTKPVGSKEYVLKVDTEYPIFQVPYDGPFVPPGVGFGINQRLLTPNHFEGSVQAKTCETWTVISDPPGLEHTFHIHQANFLVQALNGVPQTYPVWHDAIVIHQNATLHMCFDRAEAGDTIIAHCHAPNHFDIGMGALYKVTAPMPAGPRITSLGLINAKTDSKLVELTNGMEIRMQDIAGLSCPAFNINASFVGDVDAVEYWYGLAKYRMEQTAPFAFCGNRRADFFSCRKLNCGNHTVSAVPYYDNATGTPFTVSFSIVC